MENVQKIKKKILASIVYFKFKFSHYSTWLTHYEGLTCQECDDPIEIEEMSHWYTFPDSSRKVTIELSDTGNKDSFEITRSEKDNFPFWEATESDTLLPEGLESLFETLGDKLPEKFYINCYHS